jgi:serine/threonine protein kinase
MIELGHTVGNYRITAKLGEGGMGAVYLAEHPLIGRKAALKVIHPRHAQDADVVARFVNEAAAISRIGHEHIVEVTDLGRTPAGEVYIIMEYLEGQTLSDLLAQRGPLPSGSALAIAAQVADALSASHEHGFIHRDVKPDNVFLVARAGDPTFVKVLDFGLAKLLHADAAAPPDARSGVVIGTPYYMSPEQCRAGGQIDERADVYALGVVLFEMLTGKLPFGGDASNEVLLKQVSMRPPSARSIVPDLPEELDAILLRALAKAPDHRFSTMAAFREALLAPAEHSALDRASDDLHDDLSGRLLAARPMSRAEMARLHGAPRHRRTAARHRTFEAKAASGGGPRRRGNRALGLLGVFALGGLALTGAVAHRNPSKARAAETTPSLGSERLGAERLILGTSPDASILDAGLPDGGAVEPPTPLVETKARNLR